MHALVMLTMLDRHLLLSITALRCLQKIWLDLEVDELLHFLITFLNSSFEKLGYSDKGFKGISSKMCKFTWWFCAELNVWCSTCHRSSSSVQGCLLYWRVSVAGSLHFLTQFMRSQGLLFLNVIYWIFSSKKVYFVFLTILLNFFQSSNDLKEQ